MDQKKMDYLKQIDEYKKCGYDVPKHFNINSSLSDMEHQLDILYGQKINLEKIEGLLKMFLSLLESGQWQEMKKYCEEPDPDLNLNLNLNPNRLTNIITNKMKKRLVGMMIVQSIYWPMYKLEKSPNIFPLKCEEVEKTTFDLLKINTNFLKFMNHIEKELLFFNDNLKPIKNGQIFEENKEMTSIYHEISEFIACTVLGKSTFINSTDKERLSKPIVDKNDNDISKDIDEITVFI